MKGPTLTLILIVLHLRSTASKCDVATTARIPEGNFGQSPDFNWLGVLNLNMLEGKKVRVALTGIVLIKYEYALASADDVARVPLSTFKSECKAIFMSDRDTPLYVQLEEYLLHHEYEYSTLNSLALVKLDVEKLDYYPMNPICLPTTETFNSSRYLYLTGYTDQNRKLEKVIYKMQYMSKKVCEEFYSRAGLSSQQRVPSAYVCVYAPSNKSQCVWDNGMVLVSNVTGFFQLIGFGVRGPGCAAPSRIIDLFPYFQWIESTTEPDEVYEDFKPEFKRRKLTGSRRQKSEVGHHESTQHPLDTGIRIHHIIDPNAHNTTINITS